MRVLFCGGGTAGHVMPALAISKILKKGISDVECAFVGRSGGPENRSILREGERLYTVDIHGFRRSLSPKNLIVLIKLIKSMKVAKGIIRDFRPDIIIGTGGYVCYPILRMGQRMKIKTVLHESNVYPGLVTRILARRCEKVLLSSAESIGYLKAESKTEVVGNPVRDGFRLISRDEARRKMGIGKKDFFIVSFGGSLGAAIINDRIADLMSAFSLYTLNVQHLHSVGASNYEDMKKRYPRLCQKAGKCKIVAYIDDMPTALAAADLAITRSGAMTLTELAAVGVASILIPSPNVTANHQYINAKHLSDAGAAIVIEEKDLTTEKLLKTVRELHSNAIMRTRLGEKMKESFPQNTDEKILAAIKNTV